MTWARYSTTTRKGVRVRPWHALAPDGQSVLDQHNLTVCGQALTAQYRYAHTRNVELTTVPPQPDELCGTCRRMG